MCQASPNVRGCFWFRSPQTVRALRAGQMACGSRCHAEECPRIDTSTDVTHDSMTDANAGRRVGPGGWFPVPGHDEPGVSNHARWERNPSRSHRKVGGDEAEGLRTWLLHPRRGQGSPLPLRVLDGWCRSTNANTKGSTGHCPSELRSERKSSLALAVGRRSTRSVGTHPEGGAPTGSDLTVSRGGVCTVRHTAHRGCHRARPISW